MYLDEIKYRAKTRTSVLICLLSLLMIPGSAKETSEAVPDFIEFYNSPYTIFIRDIR